MINETIITATSKLEYIGSTIKPLFTKIVVAVIVLLIGFIAGRLIGRLIQKGLSEIELNNIIKKIIGIRLKLEEFISNLIMYFIYFIVLVMALDILGVTSFILHIISIIIIIIIILSFILSIKDFIPNMVAGFFIHRKNFIKEGKKIEVDNIKGRVIRVDLTDTIVQTSSGDEIYIPNSLLMKKKVVRKKR